MVYQVHSLGLHGITGYPVSVECDLSSGLPAFTVVGLPDAAVNEARERVRSAIKNCGFTFPVSRITVNLAPAHVKKIGTLYDLPILVGLLAAGGQLKLRERDSAFVGELSLSGGDGSWLSCGKMRYEVETAQAVYVGERVSHWWAVLRPGEEEP